ncbi:MAG: hypothetical protein O2816_05750 [Planctomycetota bacterium]|nr:hypothetical protein [Planctomycetota bacterium]
MKLPESPLRILGGIVAGHAAMVIGITLAQEVAFGGVSYTDSSLPVLAGAGAGTIASALLGGWIASRIAGLPANVVQVILVALETSWLIQSDKFHDPLWFDLLAGLSLVVGILLGGWIQRTRAQSIQRSSMVSSSTST